MSARIEKIEKELKNLASKGNKERAARLSKLQSACATVSERIQSHRASVEKLNQLELEVNRALTKASSDLLTWKTEYATVSISGDSWSQFQLAYEGEPGQVIAEARKTIDAKIKRLRHGPRPQSASTDDKEPALERWSLSALQGELSAVEKQVGLDRTRSRQYKQLQRELAAKQLAKRRLDEEITHVKGAQSRQAECVTKRRIAYSHVFQTLVDEQEILKGLYEPLTAKLKGSGGTIDGLEFVVRRRVDAETWVDEGEGLFDLRQATQLRGRGQLLSAVRAELLDAWKTGDAGSVERAMARFIEKHGKGIVQARLLAGGETVLEWYGGMASWLFTTDHVRLEYSVRYSGTEIERLSPGMRGIVLLILYLAVDEWDSRPLIVDQPEDNLDPKSVFTELVGFFREARLRRQIVLVTHNANLVVNADADQVVVAECEHLAAGELPRIRYVAGGLDEKRIRDRVCDLLEGGKDAFKERERRYRLRPGT